MVMITPCALAVAVKTLSLGVIIDPYLLLASRASIYTQMLAADYFPAIFTGAHVPDAATVRALEPPHRGDPGEIALPDDLHFVASIIHAWS
jgi:hypothetical protein